MFLSNDALPERYDQSVNCYNRGVFRRSRSRWRDASSEWFVLRCVETVKGASVGRSAADFAKLVDWADAVSLQFPLLKPVSAAISVHLPDAPSTKMKLLANVWDVPYQSLRKLLLAERVAVERRRKRPRASARPSLLLPMQPE